MGVNGSMNPTELMGEALKQQQLLKQTAPMDNEDTGRWELDTEKYLDRIYHELLGQIADPINGNWVRDFHKNKTMNEKGASEFTQELTNLCSIHMQFSDLDDKTIIEIASRTAEHYGEKLVDKYEEWEVSPVVSNLKSIAWRLYHDLLILLRIARNGGMKKHREKSKNPYANIPTMSDQPEQGVI